MTAHAAIRPASGETRAIVVVLYGGKAASHAPSRPFHLSAVRMVPFARSIHRAGGPHVAVWTVRYRFRGWNGAEASPVSDARDVLARIRAEHPGVPVLLVGHSMGGRTALRVAADDGVLSVVALAPWLPPDEPIDGVRDRDVLIVHGTRDRWTDPRGSLAWARRAQVIASRLRRIELRGVGHFMLRRTSFWHRVTTLAVLDVLASLGGSDQSADLSGSNTSQGLADGRDRVVVDPTRLSM